jgi:hypothetical protein
LVTGVLIFSHDHNLPINTKLINLPKVNVALDASLNVCPKMLVDLRDFLAVRLAVFTTLIAVFNFIIALSFKENNDALKAALKSLKTV